MNDVLIGLTALAWFIHSSLPPDDDVSDDDGDADGDGVGDAGDTCVLASFATWLRLHYVALLLRLSCSLLLVILWLVSYLSLSSSPSLSVCLPFRRSMVTLSVSGLVVDCLIPLPAPSRSRFPSSFPLARPGWLSGYLVGWLSAWLPPILSYIPQTNATNVPSTARRPFSPSLFHSVCLDECYSHFAVGYSNVALSRCQLPALMMHSHLCTAAATATKTTTATPATPAAAGLACFAALQLTWARGNCQSLSLAVIHMPHSALQSVAASDERAKCSANCQLFPCRVAAVADATVAAAGDAADVAAAIRFICIACQQSKVDCPLVYPVLGSTCKGISNCIYCFRRVYQLLPFYLVSLH